MDFFDNFGDNMFNLMWNRFNRPVKDMQPTTIYRSEGKGYVIVVNTLGMDKNDLSVKIEKQKGRPNPILHVKGETNLEKIHYNNTVDVSLELRFEHEIEDVSYEVKNGLTTVYIKCKEFNQDPGLTAKCIEDGDAFDW